MKKLLMLPLLLLVTLSTHAAIEEIDSIVAVVDEDVITRLEFDARLQTTIKQLQEKGAKLPPMKALERQLLERMIIEKLQLIQAKERGIRVGDEELNRIISRIASQNKLNLLQFREALQNEGIDFATFREEIRDEVIITRLRNKRINKRINILPQEVDNLLESQRRDASKREELHLQHILVAVPTDASPEQIAESRTKVEMVLAELKNGADFSNMAISYSSGPQALEGGDIGWRRQAQLPVAFGKVVRALKVGEISEPIRSTSGFHLLKLLEKRGEQRHVIRQVNSRHILIQTSELISDREAKQRLERLRERILGGEDFGELARAHSDDTGSAIKAGELGWADPANYVEAFRNTLNEIEPGAISTPFKSQFGWHILQVHQWRDHDDTEEYERKRAYEALKERKSEEETELWLRRLRDEAYIEIRLN